MKRIIALGVLTFMMAAGVQVASANMKDMTVDQKLQKMDSELNLTTDQETQIRPLLEQKKAGTLGKEECKTQVRALLTPEQQSKYDAMKEEKKKERTQ